MNFLNERNNIISLVEYNVESQDTVANIYLRLVEVLTHEINSVASNRKWQEILE